ncbi:hypothetical protein GCM10010245_87230 [Streptomyces spectabilis]|nr:hypothetical protein GCM10010245_87230 [Streptomyces spectabilis]
MHHASDRGQPVALAAAQQVRHGFFVGGVHGRLGDRRPCLPELPQQHGPPVDCVRRPYLAAAGDQQMVRPLADQPLGDQSPTPLSPPVTR